jgi:hypothetical protein
VLTPRGVSITLSHFCPTVAARCLDRRPALGIVRNAAAFPAQGRYEGLDARAALPPLLRREVLMCWESHALWERYSVATLAQDDLSPEAALYVLTESADRARAWRSGDGPLRAHLARGLDTRPEAARERLPAGGEGARRLGLHAGVIGAVPEALRRSDSSGDLTGDAELVRPRWASYGAAVRRYLAGRAFASWVALQGQGLRTTVFALVTSLAVLRVEAARLCRERDRPLDREILLEAFRAADRLSVHLAAPDRLADWLSRAEDLSLEERLAGLTWSASGDPAYADGHV